MKKILSICLVLVMVMSFNLTAFAKGGFVNSPSENLAPEIVDSSDDGIVIHSYADRHELTEKEREDLEDAYDSIKGSTDLSDLNANLGSLAKNKNINPDQLRVIYNTMTNYITYVDGPPGTGKTHTILNVILSSFFNDKTVLICSSNNKPINGILEKLSFSIFAITKASDRLVGRLLLISAAFRPVRRCQPCLPEPDMRYSWDQR